MDSGAGHPYRDNTQSVARLKAETDRERYRARMERKFRRAEHRRKHGKPRKSRQPTIRIAVITGTFLTKVPLLDQHAVELIYVVIIVTLVRAGLNLAWP